MNTVGIDYQRTATVAWVREEGRAVGVGDGWRPRIPTAVADPALWGTAALSAERPVWGGTDPASPGPWPTPATAERFWRGLRERLVRFLGRTEPLARNGYPCVVTGERLAESGPADALRRITLAAGFESLTLVSATDALLVRWLVDATPTSHELAIVVVAIGDSTAEVVARQVRFDSRRLPKVSLARPPHIIAEVGHARLLDRALRLVHQRLKEPPRPADVPILHDAVVEFAATIGRGNPTGATEWTGPFRDRMYAAPSVGHDELRAWPEAVRAAKDLPTAIATALRGMNRKQADIGIVGGSGAAWPHFADIVASHAAKLWTSGDPTNDLAYGAAWLPVYSERLGLDDELPALLTVTAATAPMLPTLPIRSEDELPPWERSGA